MSASVSNGMSNEVGKGVGVGEKRMVTRQVSTGTRKYIVSALNESINKITAVTRNKKSWTISATHLNSAAPSTPSKVKAKAKAKAKSKATSKAETSTSVSDNASASACTSGKSITKAKKAKVVKSLSTKKTLQEKKPKPIAKKKENLLASSTQSNSKPNGKANTKSKLKTVPKSKVVKSVSTKKSIQAKPKKSVPKKVLQVKKTTPAKASPSSKKKVSASKKKDTTETKSKKATNKLKLKKATSTVAKGTKTSTPKKARVKVAKLTTVALKKHEMRNDDLVTIRPPNRGDSWDGNSDADGSVNSGILDENVCFACGEDTSNTESKEIVVCDVCGGDYHFTCAGLEILPRLSFKCQDCLDEIEWNTRKDFDLHNAIKFPIPKKRNRVAEVCYSPARPLELAWQECLTKGFMLVKNVFSHSVIDKLTHGGMERLTKYGRIAESWTGAVNVLASQINKTTHNIINRDGRFDIKIPSFVVRELQLEVLLEPILSRLRTIMSPHRTPLIRTHNIIFAPVGSESQTWHFDDSRKKGKYHSYFTVLIHLNSIDDLCGGTEIWSQSLKRGDLIRGRPGDAFVFNGSLLHRGQGNRGFTHRWFYYASFSCTKDANEVRL